MIFKSARSRGLTNPESRRTVHLRGLCGPLIRLPVGVSRIACWKFQRNNATGIPISQYAKSRLKSQLLNQDQIWTVDSSPCRSFEDRELDMSKIIDIRNLDIAICEIAI
jgi:hypothetical protein